MSVFSQRDEAALQLTEYARKNKDKQSATTTAGNPIPYINAQLTVGYKGPLLWQDWFLLDELAHFTRERIPERVVHAKGSGAFGYFEVTDDITQFTAAKVFAEIGKRTPLAVRFSQVSGERGYPDTVRDPRGFAVKFYTEDGIWDLVGNNTPVFFIRDTTLFPSFVHILKRNPVTNLRDPDMYWDMMTVRPECTHQVMITFGERGIPNGYRHMHGYGSHTYAFVNEHGTFTYCKFHFLTDQGIRNLTDDQANAINSTDPDYFQRDLYNAIARGDHPTWTLYVQVLTPEQTAALPYHPFDVTKVWFHADAPLLRVGKLVLDKNPTNYFAEVEQIGFDPAHFIPGIEPSPDRMLQGRLFAYSDTHRHRIGPNFTQVPVNSPARVTNYTRDGYGAVDNQGGAPNYHPNSFNGPASDARAHALSPVLPVKGDAQRYDNGDDDNFSHPRALYQRVLTERGRSMLVRNLVSNIQYCADFIQERAVKNFAAVDEDFGRRVGEGLRRAKAERHLHADL